MKNSDKKIVYSILLGLCILLLLGAAGSYDQKCEQEDAQIQQELQDEYKYNQLMIEHYEDSIY